MNISILCDAIKVDSDSKKHHSGDEFHLAAGVQSCYIHDVSIEDEGNWLIT